MNWRALLLQPAVLTAVTSMMFGGGQTVHPAAVWLNRAAALFGIIALGMMLFFGWLWLDARYPLEDAALIFSIFTAAAGVFCFGVAWVLVHYRSVRRMLWQKKLLDKVEGAYDCAVDELESFGRDNPKTAVALATVLGYLLADRAVDGTEKLLAALDLTNSHHAGDREHV